MWTREIKKKICEVFSRSHLECVKSVDDHGSYVHDFQHDFKRTIENYPIYYLTGTIFWQLFSGATNSAMTALVDNRTLLLKVKLPKQTFVLARIYTALTNFGYTLCRLCAHARRVSDQNQPDDVTVSDRCIFSACYSPWESGTYSQSYTCFCGHQISVFNRPDTLDVHVGDLFYPYESTTLMMQKVIGNNPVFVYIAFARDCVMYQKWPETDLWIKMILWGIVSFLIGYHVFSKKENNVMQKI